MSEQNAGPSPEGVMHGPYPKTEAHPWDQSIGHENAVDEAIESGRITPEQGAELYDNLISVHMDAHTESLAMEEEAVEQAEIVSRDHEEALQDNESRDNTMRYIEQHGKPQNYDYYIKGGKDPVEALEAALRDDYEQDQEYLAQGDDGHYHDEHEYEDEDPLAGDVEPTGGYHEETPSPTNTQHYHALKERGLL